MKVRPGACGICGCAVVTPESSVVDKRLSSPSKGDTPPAEAWVDGHLYANGDGKPHVLKKVRCYKHADDEFDPRINYW